MTRYGMRIGLRPEAHQEYVKYHAAVWPEVLATIARCHIRNYTIFHRADMARMAADPTTQRWWAIMIPMQERIPGTPEGEWWMPMEEVFHFDGAL